MSQQVLAPALNDLGSQGVGTSTPDLSKGLYVRLVCTGATRTIANPIGGTRESPGPPPSNVVTLPVDSVLNVGTLVLFEVRATGGALTLTWGSIYKTPATAIANGFRRIFPFVWTGTELVLLNPSADSAN
jgi:hypothetical protein